MTEQHPAGAGKDMSTRHSTVNPGSGLPARFIEADGEDVLDMQEACDRLNDQAQRIAELEAEQQGAAEVDKELFDRHEAALLKYEDRIAELENAMRSEQLFLANEIINNGLQLRRRGEKNTMQWWYADGSNAEGEDLVSLFDELASRKANTTRMTLDEVRALPPISEERMQELRESVEHIDTSDIPDQIEALKNGEFQQRMPQGIENCEDCGSDKPNPGCWLCCDLSIAGEQS